MSSAAAASLAAPDELGSAGADALEAISPSIAAVALVAGLTATGGDSPQPANNATVNSSPKAGRIGNVGT
jgi:hypothetical protein